MQVGENRWYRPATRVDNGLQVVAEHPRQVLNEAPAGDVGNPVNQPLADQRQDRPNIDFRRRQEGFTDRLPR